MRNRKGISMISLVIAIIVIIILIGVATTTGYRYVTESNKLKAEAVVNIISNAAYRRQNDLSTGVAVAYYEGFAFKVDGADNENRYSKITGLPQEDKFNMSGEQIKDGIPDCLQGLGAKWYLFDANSAKELGVEESEKFITINISYLAGLKEEDVTLVLADYSSGKGYLINMSKDVVGDSIRVDGGCLNSPNGNHNFKIIATCTTPALCVYCGEADPLNLALGHDFSNPTCTTPGICRRCGEIDPNNGALGHLMISNDDINNTDLVEKLNARECRLYINTEGTNAWVTDANKHWHECIRCGEKSEEKEHTKGELPLDEDYHYSMCSECGWTSIKAKHVYTYTSVTNNTHLRKCKICLYEQIHQDSGWKYGNSEYHYRICEYDSTCNIESLMINGSATKVLFKEKHYDLNFDLYCDVCGQAIDNDFPFDIGSEDKYYGKVINATTNSIKLEAYTEDEGVGIDYYEFGIANTQNGQIQWSEKIYPSDQSSPVQKEYDNLKSNTQYVIYVKATDKAGNTTNPYKIPDTKTKAFPNFNGLTNIPTDYVKGPINAGFVPVDTELTNIVLKYSLDNGATWIEVPIADVATATIELTKEIEKVLIKFADIPSAGGTANESEVWEYTIAQIDSTPPSVLIAPKAGDDNTKVAIYHTAKITLKDEKSGLTPETEVSYAWSTSNTEVPDTFTTIFTENTSTAKEISFEVVTPKDVKGTYYLWINKGIKDRVGNETTEPECGEFGFNIDTEDVTVTNIKMEDLSPAVAKEYLFVKTDGVVTVSFETDKKLGDKAKVTINGQEVEMISSDGLSHRGTVTITDSFVEGELQLEISNIVSEAGKVSNKIYTNDDLTTGPVIYDRTVPTFEYISKQ